VIQTDNSITFDPIPISIPVVVIGISFNGSAFDE
jgi:hypothetical protein